jgi:uncharacterized protein (TIGR02271 family)
MGPQELVGSEVFDDHGEKVGRVGTVYLGEESKQPEWVTVHTGMFGHRETFVPLAGAQDAADGLHVRWPKAKIKDAPRIDADGMLSAEDSMGLYEYYGMPIQRGSEPRGRNTGKDRDRAAGTRGDSVQSRDEQTMTRSEEQLKVGTQRVESGRVRLRKHVVTEEQQVTVPVSHEEVTIEREPIDPKHAARAGRGEIGEQEQEVVLHRDEPVVGKESVPVERVRMRTKEVTEEERVKGQVRKERIEVDDDQRKRR